MNGKFIKETKVWKGIEIPWPFPLESHIGELVINGLKKTPQRIIQISADDGSKMTCDELRLKIIAVAQNLTKLGIKDEDVVGMICANSLNLMAFTNGIIQLGAIVNPMSVEHSKVDLINMFKQTRPMLVICDAGVYEKVNEVLGDLGCGASVYTTISRLPGVPFADELLESDESAEDYQPQKFKDPSMKTMAVLTSSGTTGPAKGVRQSQTYYLKMCALTPPEEGRSLSFSPIFW